MNEPVNDPPVISRIDGAIGRLILNRPKAINALDHEMVGIFGERLHAWAHDDTVAAVLVSGAGERGLCAGGDIVAIHRDAAAIALGASPTDSSAQSSLSAGFWRDEYRLNALIAEYPKPYVVLMDGIVMGGGVGISAHGNTRVVTERTRLAMPETGIGFVPDVGGTHLLARIPDELGTYLALTAGSVTGSDAIAVGLADHYVPSDRLDTLTERIVAVGVDAALTEVADEPPVSELWAQREWIAAAFAGDSVPEIVGRCRDLATPESTRAADAISRKSPTALAVTLRSLRTAATEASLHDALVREYRVSLRCLQSPDLAEGIRAQVIDKDRNPAWQPAGLDDVGDSDVEPYFAALPDDLTFTTNEINETNEEALHA